MQQFPTYCSPNDFQGAPNILYRNNGDGTFTDVSTSSHIGQYVGKGMGVAFADYDGDGFTDIFVSNDTYPNLLLHNNGDRTFTDEAMTAGVAYNETGKTVAGMGADFRDLNNDGLPDIFHTAMFGHSFPLYKNSGDGRSRLPPSLRTSQTIDLGSRDRVCCRRRPLRAACADSLRGGFTHGLCERPSHVRLCDVHHYGWEPQ
jgi:hypothetical protein